MEKITDLKFYCADCGKELNVNKINIYYDRYTGKEKYFLKWTCTEIKWYNFIFKQHDSFVTNMHGRQFFDVYD